RHGRPERQVAADRAGRAVSRASRLLLLSGGAPHGNAGSPVLPEKGPAIRRPPRTAARRAAVRGAFPGPPGRRHRAQRLLLLSGARLGPPSAGRAAPTLLAVIRRPSPPGKDAGYFNPLEGAKVSRVTPMREFLAVISMAGGTAPSMRCPMPGNGSGPPGPHRPDGPSPRSDGREFAEGQLYGLLLSVADDREGDLVAGVGGGEDAGERLGVRRGRAARRLDDVPGAQARAVGGAAAGHGHDAGAGRPAVQAGDR